MVPLFPTAGRRGTLAALAACASTIFGGAALVAMRAVVAEADPAMVALLRNGIGALVLVPVAIFFARTWPRGRDGLVVAFMGVMFFGLFQFLLATGLQFTTAGRAGIVMSAMPFITMMLAAALGVERMSTRKAIGVALATFGVAFALWQNAGAVPGAWRGDLVVLVGAAIIAGGNVFFSVYARRYDAAAVAGVGIVPAVIFLWLIALASGSGTAVPVLSTPAWLAIGYAGLFGAGASYFLWLWALRHTTPTLVAVAVTLNPVAALVLGALVLAEPVTGGLVAGLILVFGGIVVANWRRG